MKPLRLLGVAVTLVSISAPGVAPASEEAARRFVERAVRDLGLEPIDCPAELRGYLPLSEITCARTDRPPKRFKKAWDTFVADPAIAADPTEPGAGWNEHRVVCLADHREVWEAFWTALQSPELPIVPVPDGGGWPGFSRTHRVRGTSVTVHYAESGREVFLYHTASVPECPAKPPEDNVAGRDGVRPPRVLEAHHTGPVYPVLPRMAKIEATVVLQATVGVDGRPRDPCVVRSERPGLGFEQAAVEALRLWRYEPATRGGEPVEALHTVEVEFTFR